MAPDGLITRSSRFSVEETIDRLATAAQAAGLLIFARIDHARNAAESGFELRPTQPLILGNPRGGTPLMRDRQTAGIDLPLHALAWEDAEGAVRLAYPDPGWLAARHGLGEASSSSLAQIEAGMAGLAAWATAG
ncbi:MAG TPA: DUF302 domain-containing protein [Candidatus Dormibacteraeota bacterium]|jgi:uncharacterized protein (DUF302 family)|nr:DUF302 domain-containing protein [Candidatus Dormibacteraeota bacterium]